MPDSTENGEYWVRFSAATTADRLLPQRLALRARPLLDRVDGLLFGRDARGEAGRISVIAFAIRIVSAVIAFVSQVLLARWMGSFEYGIFVLVWTTMIIVGNLACLGFHTSVIRFIPEYREKGMLDELRGILLSSRLFVLAASTLIALTGALGVLYFAAALESYYVVPFVLGIICLPMIALSDLLQGISRAHAWALAALSPTYIIRPVLILVFMAAALIEGYRPCAETAVLAAIAATYATTLWQLVSVSVRIDARMPASQRPVLFGTWLVGSVWSRPVQSF